MKRVEGSQKRDVSATGANARAQHDIKRHPERSRSAVILSAAEGSIMKKGYVYILTNKTHSVLYIGVTSNIAKRIYEHKTHAVEGFTAKYNVDKLIYVEEYSSITDAIAREKQLKGWRRSKKDELIKEQNPKMEEIEF